MDWGGIHHAATHASRMMPPQDLDFHRFLTLPRNLKQETSPAAL
jgi:hypothetical protein